MTELHTNVAPVPPMSPEAGMSLHEMGSLLLGQAIDVQQPTDLLLEVRNARLDAALNPEGTLPHITLINTYERHPRQSATAGVDSYVNRVLNDAGEDVGYVHITMPYGKSAEKPGAGALVEKIELQKNQGFGKAAYLEVLKRLPVGVTLRSGGGGSLSPDALKVWRWMEAAGVARNLTPDQELIPNEKGKFEGTRFRTIF